MTYYLKGNLDHIKTKEEAEIWQTAFEPSVIRKMSDGTFSFCALSKSPLQPGQAEFKILETDDTWLI